MHTRINSCWTWRVCMAFTSLVSGRHYYKPVKQAVPVYSESAAESVENWGDRIQIPLAAIQKKEIIERDEEKSTRRTVAPFLGFLLGINILISILEFWSGFSMGL
ncbi:hypothetical protein [Lunatimonas salinarum]|uniref:hypothetical protein n=1 Tax=Lunatimonas salinarum TaxID=1774590 RepID=UPI001ADF678C|nr:hypothetical protein [Lunatimonas salinarum]